MLAEKAQPIYQPVENEHKKRTKKNQKKPMSNVSRANKTKYILMSVVCLMLGLILLSRYVAISTMRGELTALEEQKETLVRERTNLEAKLEGIKSSERISEEASLKLGMNYPEEGQIAYISVAEEVSSTGETGYIKGNLEKAVNAIQVFFGR